MEYKNYKESCKALIDTFGNDKCVTIKEEDNSIIAECIHFRIEVSKAEGVKIDLLSDVARCKHNEIEQLFNGGEVINE